MWILMFVLRLKKLTLIIFYTTLNAFFQRTAACVLLENNEILILRFTKCSEISLPISM